MPNYGDATLNLPGDWNRMRMAGDQAFLLTTIGHENGVSDVRLKSLPDDVHQFRWVLPADATAVSMLRSRHFDWVNKNGGWEKNPNLWEWDGEGFLTHNGQRLMARSRIWMDKEKQEAEEREEQDRRRATGEDMVDQVLRRIEERGGTITDEAGRQLRPMQPQKKKN